MFTGGMKIIAGFLSGIGSIITLISGAYLDRGEILYLLFGFFILILAEIMGIYLTRYESEKNILSFKSNFLTSIGGAYALPVILVILYFYLGGSIKLGFVFAIVGLSTIRVLGSIAKSYYIDKSGRYD